MIERHPAEHHQPITAVEVFAERCEARACLFAAGVFDLHEAVDVLQADAVRGGLVDEIGQGSVQTIMADAFSRVRITEPNSTPLTTEKNTPLNLPTSTVRVIEHLITQNDPGRLRAWLAMHTRDERLAIRRHFKQRKQ
jgi:hypothetical protein